MNEEMKFKVGDRFRVTREANIGCSHEYVGLVEGDELTVVGFGLTGWINRRGYTLKSVEHGILPRNYPRKFLENYCKKLEDTQS